MLQNNLDPEVAFDRWEQQGLIMFGQMTGGSWMLHRHPGHPPGHLRDLRQPGAPAGLAFAQAQPFIPFGCLSD